MLATLNRLTKEKERLIEITVDGELTEDEIPDFWKQIMKLKFGIIWNDPPDDLGNYSIRITYNDGYVDLIGTRINHYLK